MSDPDPTVPPGSTSKKARKRGGKGKQAKALNDAAPAIANGASSPEATSAARSASPTSPVPAQSPVAGAAPVAVPAAAPTNGSARASGVIIVAPPTAAPRTTPAAQPVAVLARPQPVLAASGAVNESLSLDDSSPHAALEDDFFRQGIEAERPGTAGHVLFEALDRDHRRSRPLAALLLDRLPALVSLPPVKKREAALLAGGAGALGVLGLGLWLIFSGDASASNPSAAKPAAAPVAVAAAPAAPVVAAPAVAPVPAAPAAPAAAAPAVPVVAAAPEPSGAAAVAASPTAAAVAPEPAVVPADKAAVAAPAAPAAAEVVARPALTAAALGGAVEAKPLSPEFDSQIGKCREANSKNKYAVVVESCGLALAAKPDDPEAALMIAHAEFERGRSAQALTWARKVINADPSQADAYVFMGGAEQAAGRTKAAREAYRKYLELAPKGRYASDLRVILQTL